VSTRRIHSAEQRPRSHVRRWLVILALAVVLVAGGGLALLRVKFHGPALAGTIEGLLNEQMRGEVRIGSVDWKTSDLTKVVTGGWIPFTLDDVDVYDGDGKHILHVERITCELDIHALMFGNHDFVLRNMVLDTGWGILEEIPEPYQLHAYDTKVISLFAAFYAERKPGFHWGVVAGSPPVFDVQDVELRDIDLTLLFQVGTTTDESTGVTTRTHGLEMVAHDVDGSGFFYIDPSDPLVPKVYFSIPRDQPLTATTANLTIANRFRTRLEEVQLVRFAQLPTEWPRHPIANDLEILFTAVTEQGATITVDGLLDDYWDSPFGGNFAIDVRVENAGQLAHDVIDPWMSGDDLQIHARMGGPIYFPRIEATLENLEYSVELRERHDPLKLYLDLLNVEYDFATETGNLRRTIGRVDQPGDDGEVSLTASFGLDPYRVDATVAITQPIELGWILPDPVKRAFGTKVWGSLRAVGDSEVAQEINELDLHLGRLHLDGGRIYSANVEVDAKEIADGQRSEAEKYLQLIELSALRAHAGDTEVTIAGEIRPGPETFDLRIDLDSGDLDTWLRRFDLPVLARRARARQLHARGTIDAPTAEGTIALAGVPVIDDLSTTFSFGDQELTIHRGTSKRLGDIRAHGTIDLHGPEPRAERLVITGRNVELGKLPLPRGVVTGKVDVDVVADGPLDPSRIRIDAKASSDDVTLLGTRATKLRACHNHDPRDPVCAEAVRLTGDDAAACLGDARRGGHCLLAGVARADGGTATVVARTDPKGRLAGQVTIDELPIDAVATLAGTGELPAGGTAALTLDLGGTIRAPTAEGAVSILRSWVLGTYLGDERFEIRVAQTDDPRAECSQDRPRVARTATGKLALCGELKDGRIVVAAVVGTSGTMPVRAEVDVRRVEIDPFVDLQEVLGAPSPLHAWVSGTVVVETELLRDDAPLSVRLELPEVAVIVPRTDSDGRPAPLVVSNRESTPLSVSFDGKDVVLNRPVTLETPAGALTLSGRANQDRLALDVSARLDLADLAPYLPWFDEARGTVTVAGTVTGTFADPAVKARIDLKQIMMRPTGRDTELRITDARLDLDPRRGLAVNALAIDVVDPSSGEKARMRVQGGVQLDGFRPKRWGVIITGNLAGRLLVALAPTQLAQASGYAALHVDILTDDNTGETNVTGDLTFNRKRPLILVPRGLRREIALSGGRVEITEKEVALLDVEATIDDEGRFYGVNGELSITGTGVSDGRLTLHADGVPFRPPNLDLVLSARDIELLMDDTDGDGAIDMEIRGTVAVVQGRFTRKYSFGDVLRPDTPSAGAPSRPLWEEYPMLGNAALDLAIEARSFKVENNMADVELTGDVKLTGTPRDPRVDGQISVVRGTFKLPGTRARFTRTTGTVTFETSYRLLVDTPALGIVSEADFRDSNGQNHLITLALTGTPNAPHWELTTSTGLNKSESLVLILRGRPPDDAVRGGVDPLAGDPTQIDPRTNPTDSYTDQLIKDVAGDFIAMLVGDPLQDVDLLDVARLEVGTGSVGFHGERRVYSGVNVIGDFERTVQGRTVNVRVEAKSSNGLAVQLGYLGKTYDDDVLEDDVSDYEGKLVYRWSLP
jgi:hypothetical protein